MELVERVGEGDRRALGRLVSHVENDTDPGREALAAVYPAGGDAMVVGVTGAPGSGKSTLVDRLVGRMVEGGTVAVVAVDPSSVFSGGAVLGDRVRMQSHGEDPRVFIRSMANRGRLGGVADATPRVVALLDGLGFDEIIVETVGVGQSEVDVASTADTVVVVVNPGWGDSVQTAKAGLLEIGDVFVVNKADRAGADETVADLTRMIELGGRRTWTPRVVATVATTGVGVDALEGAIAEHRTHLEASGELHARRTIRARGEVESAIRDLLRSQAASRIDDAALMEAVLARVTDPWSVARIIVDGR